MVLFLENNGLKICTGAEQSAEHMSLNLEQSSFYAEWRQMSDLKSSKLGPISRSRNFATQSSKSEFSLNRFPSGPILKMAISKMRYESQLASIWLV